MGGLTDLGLDVPDCDGALVRCAASLSPSSNVGTNRLDAGCSVSVVIPAFNSARFIRAAIESALREAETGEVIVCDDGSTDATSEIARRCGDCVRVLELPHVGNPAYARNAGVQAAKFDVVAFLDSDDVWMPGKLERQLTVLLHDPGIAFTCTNAYRRSSPNQPVQDMDLLLGPEGGSSPALLDALILDNRVITSSVVARRAALMEAGLFSTSDDAAGVEDYDLWLRVVAEGGRFVYIDEPWLVYRDWGTSHRDSISAMQTCENVLAALTRLEQRYPSVAVSHRGTIRRRRALVHTEMSRAARLQGDRRLAREMALKALQSRPLFIDAWKSLAAALVLH